MLERSPELWNTSSPLFYRDRTKKNAAVGKFAEHFQVPHVEITRKLHNLRTQMNNEDDVVFTSNWKFFNSLLFMMGGMTCENSQSSLHSASLCLVSQFATLLLLQNIRSPPQTFSKSSGNILHLAFSVLIANDSYAPNSLLFMIPSFTQQLLVFLEFFRFFTRQ
jgi:hypothetical protein